MPDEHDAHEEIRELFRKHVSEVESGTVEIVALARDVGRRSCVVVQSHNKNVSAVSACSGERGERLKERSAELGGEHLTVLQWSASPEQLIRDAFSHPGLMVHLDSETRQASVTIDSTVCKEILRGGPDRMVSVFDDLTELISRLTGWVIKIRREG